MLERAPRPFGREIVFDGPVAPPQIESPLQVSAPNVLRVGDLIGGVAGAASLLQNNVHRALEGVPEAWRGMVARAQKVAPGLATPIVSLGLAEGAVALVRQGLDRASDGHGLWARAHTAAGESVMGGIAARMESLRDHLGGGLEAAGTIEGTARATSLATLAGEMRGEAVLVRQEISQARELIPDLELERAEGEMGAAEYGLQAYTTQQEIVSGVVQDRTAPTGEVPTDKAAPAITPEELNRIGTGITETPAPQGFWNIGTVGAGMDPAVFGSNEYSQKAADAVNRVLKDPSVRPIEGAELAAAIRDMGVPLEKVDPNQIQAAVSYINTGASGAVAEFGRGAPQTVDEQRERMALALRQVRYLAEQGPAKMDRKTAIEVMWSAARIPGHAFEGMSDDQVLASAQKTAAATNTPGNHEFKVGKHTVKLTIGEDGTLESTSTKKPSFFGKIGKIANVVLTVASFIPGPVGLAARAVQTGIALVKAIRNGGSFLDILSAGASFVGAGAAAVGRIAKAASVVRIAGKVAQVAHAVSGVGRGIQGIKRGGVGGILSGAAGVVEGIAGGIRGGGAAPTTAFGKFAGDLSDFGRNLGRVGAGLSAAEGYIRANRAVGDARKTLEQARASGDPAQVRQAEQRLAEAERGKRSAVLGGLATVGQIAGDTLARKSTGQTEPRAGEVPQEGRSSFQVGAEILSRGLNAARGINEHDFLTAGVEALGGVAAARQGTKPIAQEYVIGRDGQRIPLMGEDGRAIPGRFQMRTDFNPLNQVSSVLDGLNDWRGAERSEGQARTVVHQAEQALGRARASGNPEAIREAEAGLRQARQGLVQAELGSTLALDNAAQRFTGAVVLRNELGRGGVLRTRAGDRAAQLAAVLDDPRTSPPDRAKALEQFARLSLAAREYEQAAASGDGERMRVARVALEETEADLGPLPGLPRVAAVVGRQGAQKDAESTSTSAGRQAVQDIDQRLPWLADYGKLPAESAPPKGTWYEELLLWRGEQQGRFVQWLASLGRSAGEGAIGARPPTEQTITRQRLAAALQDDPALAEALWQELEKHAPAGSLRETAGDIGQAGGAVAGRIAWDSAEGKVLATLFAGVLATAAAGGIKVSRAEGASQRIAGTQGLEHAFDRHAAQWFGRPVLKGTHLAQWQALIERAAESRQVFEWSVRGRPTVAHLARMEGKYLVVQFFKTGDRAGQLASAFVPDNTELTAMLRRLGR